MSGLLDYVAEAIRLLRDQADAVHESHNAPGETTFEGEPEAEAAYAELERVANGLETEIAARLRGDGEQGQAVAEVYTTIRRDSGPKCAIQHVRLLRSVPDGTKLYAALSTQPAPSEQVAATYSLDADPLRIRERAADAITGALILGSRNTDPPPAGHWLVPFWDMARAEAALRESQVAASVAVPEGGRDA